MKNIIALVISMICMLISNSCTKITTDPLTSGKWIDLSHDFSYETIYWPTAQPFKLETVFKGPTKKGYYYASYNYCAAEHGGTHIDAPIHFAQERKTVDQISVNQLIGEGVVLDVSTNALKDRDYQISIEDFKSWERKNGRIHRGIIVLIRTGYGKFWPDKKNYMGTDKKGPEGVEELSFPGLHPEAAKWLVEKRNIKAVGIDTPSIDYGRSEYFKSHQALFEANVPAFENVANLDKLPDKNFYIIALPMKIKGGSGGPLRIVAFVSD